MNNALESRTIWLINQYASTPDTGFGGRHFYLAKALAKQGHRVYVIAGGYTHLLRKPPEFGEDFKVVDIDGFKFVWVSLPTYSNAHGKNRILNWFRFSLKLLSITDVVKDKPDAILFSSPSVIPFLSAGILAKRFSAKLAFEVRDIWPLTFVELGGRSPFHPFVIFMRWIEKRAYRVSDVVFSNLHNSIEHMEASGLNRSKFTWIPNGIDVEDVLEGCKKLPIEIMSQIPNDKFIVGYAGTLGLANALDYLIDAAEMLKNESSIAFVIVGNGNEKARLKERARALSNVIFIDAIEKKLVQPLLRIFDVCYIGWKSDNIYRFGISPNKLFDYFLSAKPIIHSYSGAHDFVRIASAGISVPAEDAKSIANAVLQLKSFNNEERLTFGRNGYDYVVKNHDYAKLASTLANKLI